MPLTIHILSLPREEGLTTVTDTVTLAKMIKSFKHRGLEKLFLNGTKRGVQGKHVDKLEDILDMLDAAPLVKDMGFPGSALHPLKGQQKGYWSVKISGNWRVIFRFEDGDAYDVDYIDYH